MADIVCRWRNATPKTVCELISQLPHSKMTEDDFKAYMSNNIYGEGFFKTAYQLACQLGLYYITDEKEFIPRFFNNITEEEAEKYLIFWIHNYYVPNPYTKRGFDSLKHPIYLIKTIVDSLKIKPKQSFSELCKNLFKDELGNLDILINDLNNYSKIIKIENDEITLLNDWEKTMDLTNIDRNDKKTFFENFAIKENKINLEQLSPIPHPHNRILFGAPGTGKSYKLNKQSESFPETNIERVTFHPNYSYANFVGTYKPVQDSKNQNLDDTTKEILSIIEDKNKTSQEKYDLLKKYQNKDEIGATYLPNILGLSAIDDFTQVKSDGIEQDNFISRIKHGMKLRPFVNLKSLTDDSKIKYEYIPGPFMRTYAKAKLAEQNHTGEKFLLIIEEINRANVAAVFGDVFQLLDRKNEGDSEYPINASEDIKNFLIKEHKFTEKEAKTLSIPSNMYIWATMNSADQGVFPMDTAFKRRWEFEYIGIDDGADDKNNPDYKNYKIPLQIKRNEKNNSKEVLCYNWDLLRRKINESLLKNANYINEDKLLGPYF